MSVALLLEAATDTTMLAIIIGVLIGIFIVGVGADVSRRFAENKQFALLAEIKKLLEKK